MGSQRGDDPRAATAETVAGSVDAVAATHISGETGSPSRSQPATDATVASYDRGLPSVTPARLVQVQADLYERLGEMARGGLGKISRARDLRSGRIVAIKEVIGGGDDVAVRFAREAMITANLQHPAIVPVYEVGRWPSGEPFYAMKLVKGRPLNEVIDGAPDLDARLRLVSHVLTVADALAYAHGERVIHRDLKPHNVLCGAHGETVVIDWGLARRLDDTDTSSQSLHRRISAEPGQTFVGAVMGTPSYMPPEQARGARVDERADVYAIGAMLYHLLTGAPAYTGRTLDELLDKVKSGPPQPIGERAPGVPVDLAAIVERAMAREPEQRYPSAAELAHDLRRFTTGQLVRAHRYTTWQRLRRFLGRHRAASAAVAALVVTAIVAFVSVVGARNQARVEAARAEQQRVRADTERDEARHNLVAAHTDRARVELTAQHPHTSLAYVVAAADVAGLDSTLSYLAARALERLPAAKIFPTDEIRGLTAVPGSHDFIVTTQNTMTRWNPETAAKVWEGPGMAGDIEALDDKRILAVSVLGLNLIDAATGKVTALLSGPHQLNGLLSFDPAHRWAAVGAPEGLELFDLASGKHVVSVPIGQMALPPVIAPDAMTFVVGLAVSDAQDRIAIVDRQGKELRQLCGNCRLARAMPKGFAIGESHDGLPPHVVLYDWTGTKREDITPASVADLGDVLVSDDGKYVVILLADGMIELHEVGQGLRWRHTIPDRAYEAKLDAHGRLWVLGTYGGLHVFDVGTGIEMGHWSGGGVAVRLSADDNYIAVARPSGVQAWPTGAPRVAPVAPTAARVRKLMFAEGGRMVTASDDGTVHVLEADGRLRLLGKQDQRIAAAQLTRDNRIVSASRDGTTVIRDVVSGAELERYPIGPRAELSPDGVHLALGDPAGKVTLADRTTKQTRVIGTMSREIAAVRWSPDGSRLAVVDDGGAVLLFSSDGKQLKDWEGEAVGLDLVWSHDGHWLVRIGDRVPSLLATDNGVADRKLLSNREYGMTTSAVFTADDKRVVIAGQGHLDLHDVETGKVTLSIVIDTDIVAIALSPDESLIYGGGLDRKVRAWDLARGQQQAELAAVNDVYGLVFDPTGQRLAVLTLGPAMIWSLSPPATDLPKLRAIVRCADPLDPLTGQRHALDVAGCNALAR